MKNEFLRQLRSALEENNYTDVGDVLGYFDELILDKIAEGQSEEEVIQSLGKIEDIVKRLKEEGESGEELKAFTHRHVEEDKVVAEESIDGVSHIEIDNVNTEFHILLTDNNLLYLEYDYSPDAEFRIKHINNKIKIEYKNHSFIEITRKIKNATLYIPKSFQGKLEIESVSGNLEISHIRTAKLDIDSVSGGIYINHHDGENIKISTVSGTINVFDVESSKIEFDTVSGHIDVRELVSSFIKSQSVSGRMDLEIIGNEDDYGIKVSSFSKDKKYNWSKHHDRSLVLDTLSGKINYHFINEDQDI